jgi:hypothetical protein
VHATLAWFLTLKTGAPRLAHRCTTWLNMLDVQQRSWGFQFAGLYPGCRHAHVSIAPFASATIVASPLAGLFLPTGCPGLQRLLTATHPGQPSTFMTTLRSRSVPHAGAKHKRPSLIGRGVVLPRELFHRLFRAANAKK